MESIASLRDIQTVEVFFLNAKQAIFKVSTFLRTVSNYFMLGMINDLVTVVLFLESSTTNITLFICTRYCITELNLFSFEK